MAALTDQDRRGSNNRILPVGMYAKLSKTPGSIRTPAPCLGEHNQYVFGKFLGLSQEEMAKLEKEGIIGTSPLVDQGWV